MDRRTEPRVISAPNDFRAALDRVRASGQRVGFVPTMGALHAGHLALAQEARRRVGEEGCVAVSIFVNPTQFGPNEDFDRYPRELEADVARCAEAGVDVVFAPRASDLYPAGEQTRVRLGSLAEPLCGPFRPGHFEGVATVVTKLFAASGPCVAVFGRKDYQQWRVLTRMTTDLLLPVEVVGFPTVRESDGLAMSSRNRYLSAGERARAAAIPRTLRAAVARWDAGDHDALAIRAEAESVLRTVADVIEYVDVREPDDLGPWTPGSSRALLALALRIGKTRLIDNVVLGEERF